MPRNSKLVIDGTNNCVLVVGGWHRDRLMSAKSKEVDVVVGSRGMEIVSKQFKQILKDKVSLVQNDVYIRASELHQIKSFTKFKKLMFRCIICTKTSELYTVELSSCGSTLLDDYYSRDFTINALYSDINSLDPEMFMISNDLASVSTGIADIRDRLLRTVWHTDKVMDAERCFRAIRFKHAFNLNLEKSLDIYLEESCLDACDPLTEAVIDKELVKLAGMPGIWLSAMADLYMIFTRESDRLDDSEVDCLVDRINNARPEIKKLKHDDLNAQMKKEIAYTAKKILREFKRPKNITKLSIQSSGHTKTQHDDFSSINTENKILSKKVAELEAYIKNATPT